MTLIADGGGIQSVRTTQPPPPPPHNSTGSVNYTVKHGETLGELSTRYGVSEKQILAANPQLRAPNDLSVGQEISIPIADNGGKQPAQTPVNPKDTLTSIAQSHGVSVTALATANGITNPNQVRAGTSVWIPVKGASDAGVTTSANVLQPQINAVDSAVKQYQTAHTDAQRQAASAALTKAVEQELQARASAGLPQGQSPTDANSQATEPRSARAMPTIRPSRARSNRVSTTRAPRFAPMTPPSRCKPRRTPLHSPVQTPRRKPKTSSTAI